MLASIILQCVAGMMVGMLCAYATGLRFYVAALYLFSGGLLLRGISFPPSALAFLLCTNQIPACMLILTILVPFLSEQYG